jgi:ABC-2 type transport system ATP-binding protein
MATTASRAARDAPANAIEAVGLRKSFGSAKSPTRALDRLDLTVRTGEVHAFLGPNGAGKPATGL